MPLSFSITILFRLLELDLPHETYLFMIMLLSRDNLQPIIFHLLEALIQIFYGLDLHIILGVLEVLGETFMEHSLATSLATSPGTVLEVQVAVQGTQRQRQQLEHVAAMRLQRRTLQVQDLLDHSQAHPRL